MAQIYGDIKFNGINIKDKYKLESVTVNQSDERIYGVKKSIQMQDSIGNPVFIKNKYECPSFQVELCKMVEGNPTSVSDDELEEIGRVLFIDKVSVLEARGVIYYGQFVNGESWFNGARQGYLTLTFEMATPFCYSHIYINPINSTGIKKTEIYNKSSIKNNIYIDFEFQQIGEDNEIIEIKNKTTGSAMKFTNIAKGEIIQVEGEDVLEMRSKTNLDKNIFNGCEFNSFIDLVYGRNIIEIKGKCRMNIKYQMPLILK